MSRPETRIQLAKFMKPIDVLLREEIIAPECWEYASSERPHAGILQACPNKYNKRGNKIPLYMQDMVDPSDWMNTDNY